MTTDKMPFTQHLEELRQRIIYCSIAVAIGFVFCYFFKETIFGWLMSPLIRVLPEAGTQKLIYTAPHEAFLTYLKISFLAGVFLAAPVILYHFWRFVTPGLYEHERRYLYPVVILSSIFFIGGALFGYFVVFPYGFEFFVSFADKYITPMISTKEYLSFASRLLIAFGTVFELPILTFFLAKMGLVSAPFLKKQRKYAIVIIFVLAAFITPPDLFTQTLMAGPLLILYEISVWVAKFAGRKPVNLDMEDAEEPEEEQQPHSAT